MPEMNAVYAAETLLDVQFVQDLLLNAGITAQVSPGTGTDGQGRRFRLLVEASEEAEARSLIEDWVSMPEPDEEDREQLVDSQAFEPDWN